jgi:hypothetical protein
MNRVLRPFKQCSKERHYFGGAGAATRCGSGSNPQTCGVQIRKIVKNVTNCNSFLLFSLNFLTIEISWSRIKFLNWSRRRSRINMMQLRNSAFKKQPICPFLYKIMLQSYISFLFSIFTLICPKNNVGKSMSSAHLLSF